MKARITKHQWSQIFFHIQKEYELFGTQKFDGKVAFDRLDSISNLLIPTPKTIIPFKKILYPANQEIAKIDHDRKIAFIGLTNCDALALQIFLAEFDETDLLPKRDNILVVSSECQSDGNCFCTSFGHDKIANFDLHLETNGGNFTIFGGTKIGDKIMKACGLKDEKTIHEPKDIAIESTITKFSSAKLSTEISKKNEFINFWQGIANNCFGCGACSAVCPLCFCTRQDLESDANGNCRNCLRWDACFSKSFSEIQHHTDYRPANIDRLYNWYHHKFVRAWESRGHDLCTGCGRCIITCPAKLNQARILQVIQNRKDRID